MTAVRHLGAFRAQGPWFSRTEDGRVQCDLCPRHCRMRDGQRGFCYVRRADAQGVVLESYGRASGFCIDPIEKKPLNHFYPGSSVLSFGTAGCNLGCRFCQNWDISKARQDDRLMDFASPEAIARTALERGCWSIAYTYNDPVIFAEYAIDTAHAARELGVASVAVTAGYITEKARETFFSAMDAVNVDLKAFTERFYEKQCFASLPHVLETLRWLGQRKQPWLEITTLLIPGMNDSDEEISRQCEWLLENVGASVPLHFTAFHPDFKLRNVPRTPKATLLRARKRALELGLQFVYTGNVQSTATESTYCPSCGQCVIGRDGYDIEAWNLRDGHCAHCNAAILGRFDAAQGHWGSRRARVRIENAS